MKTTPIMTSVTLNMYTWYVHGITENTNLDGFPEREIQTIKDTEGVSPKTFGIVHYTTRNIYINAILSAELRIATLYHEFGHILSWMSGGDNGEAEANFWGHVLQQLSPRLLSEVINDLTDSHNMWLPEGLDHDVSI